MSRMAFVRKHASDRGSSFVELAVSLPVVITILVGAADFGRVYYHSHELLVAARAGALYAAASDSNSRDSTNIRNTAIAAAPNVSPALTTGDVYLGDGDTTAQALRCTSADGSAWADPDGSAPWDCTTSVCTTQTVKVCYVKVTVTKSFNTISGFIPGVPRPLSISRTAWQRMQ
jgi:Flp pilus assembly protein TadG